MRPPVRAMLSSVRGGLRGRVARAFGAVAALFLVAGLLQLWSVHRLFREAASVQHLLFARVSALSDARALVYAMEAELRALRHFPPEDRARVLGSAANELRESRRALGAALAPYLSPGADPLSAGAHPALGPALREDAGRVMRAQERDAAVRLRRALARLDSLSARVVAGERTPVGTIDYAVGEVAQPMAQLVAVNRYYAERAEQHLALARGRLVRNSLALLALVLGAAAGAGVLLARSLSGTVSDRIRVREEELQALREELAERQAEVEDAARVSAAKTWFIGHVSHEFRTPLSSIIGFTSFLHSADRTLPEARRAEYLDIILRNARHLLHVINDILNLSKVEAGTLEVTVSPLYTTEVVVGVVTALRPQAEERGLRIRFADHSHHLVQADAGRLRQVLFNLLENAVKYSPRGSEIELRVTSDPQRVRIEIADQGPGIPRELQPKLFKEFSRIQPHGVKVAGAGLGLALSRRLVDLMGGEVGVVSAPGEGSTFWVELPAAGEILGAGHVETVAPGPAGRARTETVAVVDDDPDIRAYAFTILRHAGYPVVADDGEPGVGERLAVAAPELVLMDLNLRDRSGFEALAELRGVASLERVPVVAFTAASGEDVLRRVRASGFRTCLLKPVEPDELLEAVDSVFESAPAPPPAPAPEDDYLAPLREKFRGGLPDRLRVLEEAMERGDGEGFAREAHKLKGAAAGYGLRELSEAAAAAEEALRAEGGSLDAPQADALLRYLREVAAAARA